LLAVVNVVHDTALVVRAEHRKLLIHTGGNRNFHFYLAFCCQVRSLLRRRTETSGACCCQRRAGGRSVKTKKYKKQDCKARQRTCWADAKFRGSNGRENKMQQRSCDYCKNNNPC